MKYILHIACLLILSYSINAQDQIPDLLILNNDTLQIYTYPLEELETKIRPYQYGTDDHPHSACLRGYRATWSIEDNKLFLIEIMDCNISEFVYEVGPYFSRKGFETIDNKLFAKWYSADLVNSSTTDLVENSGKLRLTKKNENDSSETGRVIISIKNGFVINKK